MNENPINVSIVWGWRMFPVIGNDDDSNEDFPNTPKIKSNNLCRMKGLKKHEQEIVWIVKRTDRRRNETNCFTFLFDGCACVLSSLFANGTCVSSEYSRRKFALVAKTSDNHICTF